MFENRKRLGKMKLEYQRLQTRHDRIKYLERLVAKSGKVLRGYPITMAIMQYIFHAEYR